MAVGNTFGATALSSYGGFWISFAIIETSGFGIVSAYKSTEQLYVSLAFYLIVSSLASPSLRAILVADNG
jgi:uncharacterized protein